MIFIDTPNLISSAKRLGVPRLKFQELATILANNQKPVGCYCYVPDSPGRQRFYEQLERMGLHVVRVSPGKSVDGRLIFDVLVGAMDNTYDAATLCGGDRDYIQVVERVKRTQKTVWVASFCRHYCDCQTGSRECCQRLLQAVSEIQCRPRPWPEGIYAIT